MTAQPRRRQRQRKPQRSTRQPMPLQHPPQHPPQLSRSAPIASRSVCPRVGTGRPSAGFCIQKKRPPLSPLRSAADVARQDTSELIATTKRYCRPGLFAHLQHTLTGKFSTRHALTRHFPVIAGRDGSCATSDQRQVSSKASLRECQLSQSVTSL